MRFRRKKNLTPARELLGQTPGIEDYKRVRLELQARGEELEPVSRITRHFHGSWHLAREALDLLEVSTPRRIEERFRKRQLGKVWRYSEENLRETLERAVDEIGHLPQVAEFEWWRQRQIELATAQGQQLHLPSPTPYRRRFGTWEKALGHFGYSPEEIVKRLET
ncbi:MAG: homing endonuclease associated repeat-containing protein [Solirubrobacterales bacterium]